MNESAIDYKAKPGSHPMQPPLTDFEAAKFLGVAVQTLRNWRGLSRGPAYLKLSPGPRGRVGYLIEDLDAYRVKCRISPGGTQ
jgi:hypothetical protein